MTPDPADEPPIDTSLGHYMEERALEIALDKAGTAQLRAKVEHLLALRGALVQRRAAFHREAVARRHARGEIYSRARVAAINAMGPSRSDMDQNVKVLYLRQPDTVAVLKAHARVHFAHALMSSRLLLASCTPDIAEAARTMQQDEEDFAAAWVATIADAEFAAELRQHQREALRQLRTSTRPMVLVTGPAAAEFGDVDAQALGKAWNALDDLARTLGAEPLSEFIAVPGEAEAAAVPAGRILASVQALVVAVQDPGRKFPSKRATASALTRIRDTLVGLGEPGGWGYFEIDL